MLPIPTGKIFYRLRSAVVSWGSEWKKRNWVYTWKLPNVELYSLDTLAQLISAFKYNPYLRTSFNTGYVLSSQVSANVTYPDKNNSHNTNYVRFSGELAVAPFLKDKFYQYIKAEAEYRRLMQFSKTALAFRAFAGIGYNYGNNDKTGNTTLPFF